MASSFETLKVYVKARDLRKRISKLSRQLPESERYNLVSQMRRAALSVTNNIAEGHGSQSYRHNISFLYMARGSANELLDDLNACEDEDYFKKEHLDDLRKDAEEVIRILNGYIKFLKTKLGDNRSLK